MASQAYQLIMRTGPTPGKVFELTKTEIFLGRDPHNDIVISDSEVSRKHARLVLQAGGYVLEDLGSTNGTYVNGQRLMGPHVLRPGEVIMLGENVSLAFEIGYDVGATVAAAPAPQPTYAPPPPPAQAAAPAPRPTPQVYTGQVPPGPPEPYYEAPAVEEKKKVNTRTLILAGCGCLLVAACVLLGAAIAFDTLNLYCQPPFNTIFSFLYTCP